MKTMSSAYFRAFLAVFMRKSAVIFSGFILFAFFVAPSQASESCKLEEFRWQGTGSIIRFSGLLEGDNCPKKFVAVLRDKETGEYLGNTVVYTTDWSV